MSWGSEEFEYYDLAYCKTCQRPVYRRFDDQIDAWRHNGYHKENGSHTIEPVDIKLSKAIQRKIEEKMNQHPAFNIGCATLHQDDAGDPIPCPGYPQCSEAPGGPVEPSGPLPECTQCHGFGPALQDAIDDLTKEAEWGHTRNDSFAESLSLVLTALARHH